MEDIVVPLERNLYGHLLTGLLWERQFEKVLLQHCWEKVPTENAFSYTVKKDYSCLCMWTTQNWLGRKTFTPCGKYLWKTLIWENRHHSLTMLIWVALNENVWTIWKFMQRNVWKDIANWRTKQLNSYTRPQLHVLTAINLGKKKMDQLENCQRFGHKVF